MVTIITKNRKTLSLKPSVKSNPSTDIQKKTKPANKKKKKTKQAKISPEELKAERQALKKILDIACSDWLKTTFPTLFDPQNPKPLAIGLHHDIIKTHHALGGMEVLGFGANKPLRRVLDEWVRAIAYQEALIQPGAMRYNLEGQPVEVVSEENVIHAKRFIEELMNENKAD